MDVGTAQRIRVAAQTSINRLFRCQLRKRNNGCFASMRLHMRRRRPVTSLAARILRLLLTAGNASEMRILVELRPDIGMAGFANHAPRIRARRRRTRLGRH